jgi:hypothetical protein
MKSGINGTMGTDRGHATMGIDRGRLAIHEGEVARARGVEARTQKGAQIEAGIGIRHREGRNKVVDLGCPKAALGNDVLLCK